MSFLRWCRNQWERTTAVALVAIGLVVLLLGWIGVSGVSRPEEQIPYLVSGGILGLFLLAVGSTLWLSADLHDEWSKLDAMEETLASTGHILQAWADRSLQPDSQSEGTATVDRERPPPPAGASPTLRAASTFNSAGLESSDRVATAGVLRSRGQTTEQHSR